MDVHSYSELILYPWGDDENQTADPDMNFKNPIYDGYRGHPGDSIYQEYIHKKDLQWYESTANRIQGAVADGAWDDLSSSAQYESISNFSNMSRFYLYSEIWWC